MSELTTRERILDVALERFTEQGYEATSLREIAEPLGFTKAALYYHFRSKEEILRALLEPAVDLQRRLIERVDSARSLEDWAEALTWVADEMFDNYPLFKLADRNQAAVETLAESSEFFEDHARLHEQVEAAVMRAGASMGEQVRMVCALGAVVAFDDFGSSVLHDYSQPAVRAELLAVVRSILGLPPVPTASDA